MSVESAIACEALDGYHLKQSLVCMLARQHIRHLSYFESFSLFFKKESSILILYFFLFFIYIIYLSSPQLLYKK